MILCTTEEQKEKAFDLIEDGGFIWYAPMFLDSELYWDDDYDVPQVDEPCPHCGRLTDRHFNMTRQVDLFYWTLNHCLSCDAVWFVKDRI